ncbi:hypothetical protein ACQPZP_02165 [Spirillospora sp. CA-142024]|uniref:hypothetical protein n=1 Tax=Spirillospora sp. CA-142024 TaxID=3240036 RepID=UPI003D8F78EB
MVKRSVPVLSVLALGGVLLVTGCQSNSHSCVNGKCHVTVSGAGQTVEVNDVDVTVSQINAQGMTVSAGGSAPTTIGNGESSQVGPVMIKVTSIDGQKVKFDLN